MARMLLLAHASAALSAPGTFSVTDYGGVGDGRTLNTRAFAAAFGAAHAYYLASGAPGTVLADAGTFLSGQIVLLSGTTLSVGPGAVLLASANASDYPAAQAQWAFLYSSGATDIAVTGGGVVNGNFEAYIGGFVAANDEFVPVGWPGCSGECRPRLAMLTDSQRITVHNVSFVGSPDWTFHVLNCSYVHVYNWTQRGDERWPNNDGLDLDSSSHVLVEDSDIDTADDGVCIKGSTPGGQSVNITVRNCRIRSRSSAVKYGSNCPILMANHTFEDLYIHDSNRGLALQARDGGLLQDIVFRRIVVNGTRFWPFKWWGCVRLRAPSSAQPVLARPRPHALYLTTPPPFRTPPPSYPLGRDGGAIYISSMLRTAADPGTRVQRVLFEDITAYAENAAVLSGAAPGRALQDITLRRVRYTVTKRGNYTVSNSSGPSIEYDPHPPGVPGRVNMTGWMPGLYAEGVGGLVLEDVDIAFDNAVFQSYWGGGCVNTTRAGAPVTVKGGSCIPPTPPT